MTAGKIKRLKSAHVGRRRPTLKEVGEAANVSATTVSLVLQQKGSIPNLTRQRVLEAIESTGYERQRRSRSSAAGKPVGILSDDIENPYYAELFAAVDIELSAYGLVPVLMYSQGSVERQCGLLRSLGDWGAAGALVIPVNGSGEETLNVVKELHLPVVFGVRHLGFGSFDYVGPNYFQGMQIATRYLIELGHRRIAFVGGLPENTAYLERLAGFRMTLSSEGLATPSSYEIIGPPTAQFGTELMSRVLSLRERPTAVIAYNDQVAFGLMAAARDAGLVPGRDISLVGFDDVRAAALGSIPLTTVSTPPSRVGQEMGRLLRRRLNDDVEDPLNIIPPPLLKIRASSGPPL
jgi:LacI family transcriptional regulator